MNKKEIDKMEALVKKNISDNNLIVKDDNILVGLSGGPDSTALLYLLHGLSKSMKFTLAACYINHMIRPKAVQKEIEYCWSLCQKLRVDFHMINEDIPQLAKEMKISVETAGREFRRGALLQLAEEDNYTSIALGHHLDDAIETVLFRLFRGTGPQGMNPIRPKSDIFIRPLYNIEKADIEKYCKKNKLKPVVDRSNFDPKYSRNYIRNKIIPVIEKEFGDKYKKAVSNFSKIVSDENEYLAGLIENKLAKIRSISPGGKVIINLAGFLKLENWMKRRATKQILSNLTGNFGAGSFGEIERIIEMVDSKKKALDLTGEIRVEKDGQNIIFAKHRTIIEPQILTTYTMALIDDLNCRIECREIARNKAIAKLQKNGFKINIDLDKISLPFQVRNIKPGDKFSPLGMRGTKKVGDFLTNKKIPTYLRDEIIIIEDKRGIIWLVGHQIDNRVKISKTTKRILEIERVERRKN